MAGGAAPGARAPHQHVRQGRAARGARARPAPRARAATRARAALRRDQVVRRPRVRAVVQLVYRYVDASAAGDGLKQGLNRLD